MPKGRKLAAIRERVLWNSASTLTMRELANVDHKVADAGKHGVMRYLVSIDLLHVLRDRRRRERLLTDRRKLRPVPRLP
jgi:hypothetical protein